MKILLAFLFIFNWGSAAQEISIPQAPRTVEFVGVTVRLTPQAQQIVNAQIRSLLTPEGEHLNRKIEKMQWYFPIIEEILEEEGLPDDFKYVPVLESSLEPTAVSTSNAVGYWQFKSPAAMEMGLRMDGDVDERKDIFQSTHAAANYLKRNNSIFNNWVSSLLTYNLGAGGVNGKIPSNWTYAKEVTFDANTDPYLLKALAHRIAFEHRLNRQPDSDYRFVVYSAKKQTFNDISKTFVVDAGDLKKYNAWLVGNRIPNDKSYNVLIPVSANQANGLEKQITNRGTLAVMESGYPELQRITPENADPNGPILYKINGKKGIQAQPGDEVPQLAAKAKVGVYKFLRYNDMSEQDQLIPGQVYYLQKKGTKGKVSYHTVAEGESLWDISQMYSIRLKNLLKLNRLKNVQRVLPGRVVWMQKKRPKGQPIEYIEDDTNNPPLPVKTQPDVVQGKSINDKLNPATNRSQPTDDEVVIIESDQQLNEIFENDKSTNTTTPSRGTNGNVSGSATHYVQQGETLYSISRRYGISVDDLRRWNNLSPTATLQFNQRLIVSSSAASGSYSSGGTTTSGSSGSGPAAYHTVAAGETLYRISKNYGVTVDQLRSWNNLSGNTISVGQRLKVSNGGGSASYAASSTASGGSPTYHTVAAGETLYRISKNYGVTVDQLRSWNNLSDNTISIGQRLVVRK